MSISETYAKIISMDYETGAFRIGLFNDVVLNGKKQAIASVQKQFELEVVHQAPNERQQVEEPVVYLKDQIQGTAMRTYKSKAEILAEKKAELSEFIGDNNDVYELVTSKWDKILGIG